jgi:hypothetical protein
VKNLKTKENNLSKTERERSKGREKRRNEGFEVKLAP